MTFSGKGEAAYLAVGLICVLCCIREARAQHGGGGGVIDPPIGVSLREPPAATDTSTTPGVVQVRLEARLAPVNVNGTTATLMTYNGSFPGPTIRVQRGNTLNVTLRNGLPETSGTNMLGFLRNRTNLHTHGMHVSPKDPGDFVMYSLASGETHEHSYDTSMQPSGALNFYHPHVHGTVAEQYWAGLVGALVIEDETPLLAPYETHLLILKDIALTGAEPSPHSMMRDYMQGKEGSIVMVNGQVNPRLLMRTGQVQRLRILNASNARFYRLAIENHQMYLIGTDGGLLDRPYPVSELLMSPGERADVLVTGNQPSGNYRLRSLPYTRTGMMASDTITLMTVTYSGSQSPAQTIPVSVNPSASRINPDSVGMTPERTLVLSMGQGNGYINGQTFDTDPYMIMSEMGMYEKWTIVNQSMMDHPFHQHVNAGQVLSVSGGDSGYSSLYTSIPAWKDVVLIPKNGSATILVPVMDYDGMAMFHCHIVEHEDIGMMGHWHIMDMPVPAGLSLWECD